LFRFLNGLLNRLLLGGNAVQDSVLFHFHKKHPVQLPDFHRGIHPHHIGIEEQRHIESKGFVVSVASFHDNGFGFPDLTEHLRRDCLPVGSGVGRQFQPTVRTVKRKFIQLLQLHLFPGQVQKLGCFAGLERTADRDIDFLQQVFGRCFAQRSHFTDGMVADLVERLFKLPDQRDQIFAGQCIIDALQNQRQQNERQQGNQKHFCKQSKLKRFHCFWAPFRSVSV